MLAGYEAIALRIVPRSERPTVGELRTQIVKALDTEIKLALAKQRSDAFPDLQAARAELKRIEQSLVVEVEDVKRKHREKQQELDQREEAVRKRELQADGAAAALASLLLAIDTYESWLDGSGEMDENGKRYVAVVAALKEYREKRK